MFVATELPPVFLRYEVFLWKNYKANFFCSFFSGFKLLFYFCAVFREEHWNFSYISLEKLNLFVQSSQNHYSFSYSYCCIPTIADLLKSTLI